MGKRHPDHAPYMIGIRTFEKDVYLRITGWWLAFDEEDKDLCEWVDGRMSKWQR